MYNKNVETAAIRTYFRVAIIICEIVQLNYLSLTIAILSPFCVPPDVHYYHFYLGESERMKALSARLTYHLYALLFFFVCTHTICIYDIMSFFLSVWTKQTLYFYCSNKMQISKYIYNVKIIVILELNISASSTYTIHEIDFIFVRKFHNNS